MPDIDFSIIIPHYNIPDMLEKLLESTPYDNENVEVIVVDDRSDSNIGRLIEVRDRFKNFGVKFFRNNNGNKGAGTCRNIGLRHASGKWLLFADADDRFRPEAYEALKEHLDCEEDIVYFQSVSIDRSGNRIAGRSDGYNLRVEGYEEDPNRINELLLRFDMPVPWGKLIRAKMVRDNSIWFDEIPVSNDVMFSSKCGFHAESVKAVKKEIYEETTRTGSLTTTKDEERFKLRTNVFVRQCKYLRKNLSKNDWLLLGFNGNIRLIDTYEKGYGIKGILYVFFKLLFNGIVPVSFKGMSLKTAPNTLKRIIRERKKCN